MLTAPSVWKNYHILHITHLLNKEATCLSGYGNMSSKHIILLYNESSFVLRMSLIHLRTISVMPWCRWHMKRTLTVFMGAYALWGTARSVPRRGKAQHTGEVLCELFQPSDVTHVNAVLKIGSHRNQGNIFLVAWFPCQQLKGRKQTDVTTIA